MLKKIISIKNVGTFRNCPASPEFRKFTLIYGENGRGKTTLCTILSSLGCDKPSLITERKTIDSSELPSVEVLLDSGVFTFKNSAWTLKCQNIEIFDASFIANNVHAGDLITVDNKRNLCRVILGAQGVELAREYDKFDEIAQKRGKEVAEAKAAVEQLIPKGVGFEQFMGFQEDAKIEFKITKKRGEISILTDSAVIREKQTLSILDLPQPLANLKDLLQKTVEDLSDDAEKLVKQHLVDHKMVRGGKNWLAEGLLYATNKDCPFCAQLLDGSSIIRIYRIFFSQAYQEFQQELARLKVAVDQPLSDAALFAVQKKLMDNEALVDFWKKYIPNSICKISFEERIQPVIQGLRKALTLLVDQKLESPNETVVYSSAANSAIEEWRILCAEVQNYNSEVTTFNDVIKALQNGLDTKTYALLLDELSILEAKKFRYQIIVENLITSYSAAVSNKTIADLEKNAAKEKLNNYSDAMVDLYREGINDLLRRFGAAFTLSSFKVDYIGRVPRASYAFEIRGEKIDPGSDKTPVGTVCFKNTLSAGDRSTLALAFFIAQLKNRKDLANLIVVFDDPFSSLDIYRKTETCRIIRNFAKDALQVIVFSHSLDFLQLLTERHDKTAITTLHIDRHNQIDSRIILLDLDYATMALIEKDISQIRSFYQGNCKDDLKTIRSIRPVLEYYIRRDAQGFAPKGQGWLGNFIGDIERSDPSSPYFIFKPKYDDLDYLNSYTSPYAHDSGNAPSINSLELSVAAERTLKLIGRL